MTTLFTIYGSLLVREDSRLGLENQLGGRNSEIGGWSMRPIRGDGRRGISEVSRDGK